MKKTVSAVFVVLVLLLGVAPWGIGKFAEQRVNRGLDRLVEEAPYLGIVERKWTSGWFRSEQEVTFEVSGPWMRALNPATVLADIAKAEDDRRAAEAESAAELAVADAAPVDAPIRFTVRNEVLHGPVLGFTGVGLARVNSKVVLSDEIRKKLVDLFGTDEPVRVSTRVGFFGGGTTTFSGDERSFKLGKERGEASWDAFKLSVDYSRDLDDVDMDGKWPRLEFKNAKSGANVLLRDITLEAENERVLGDLYDTDFVFAIDEVRIVGEDKKVAEISDIRYIADTSTDDDFMSVAAKFGSGAVKSKEFTQLGVEIEEVHYDFTVRRLHTGTLAKMLAGIKASYTQPVKTIAEVDAVMFNPMKAHGLALLKHDPEFVIDRIGIATPEGDGYIKGVIKLKGVTEEDLATGGLSLIGKIDAEVTIDVSQKMVEKFPNGAVAAGTAIDGQYAKREGERLVSKIEFRNGELKVNGKAQGIPGLGGPPPGRPPEGLPPEELPPEE